MNTPRATTTRRRILSVGLFALVSAIVPGAILVPDASAGKKKKKVKANGSVIDRTQTQREACETIGGGQLAVLDGPHGSNTTECKGGDNDGYTCFNTKKDTTCWKDLTRQPSSPLNDSTAPPTEGNEQPYDGGKPAGGGHVDPIGGVGDPGSPPSGPIILLSERHQTVAESNGENSKTKRAGKRRRHGKSRKK